MTIAFIALGSNLEDPLSQVERAVEHITQHPQCETLARAPWYRSAAIGPGEQPDYVNGVIKISTNLDAFALLDTLLTIENQQGRVRNLKWGPRTLDLDLLLYDKQIINSERLQIPHPRMCERNFVLLPLYDLEPDLVIPERGALAELIQKSHQNGLAKIQK